MSAPQQLGPYRIVRPLGQGGMGAVYEAVQEPLERRVAVKVLLPQHAQDRDAVHRFFNEARAVNLIEHPSIVQVSDYVQVPDGPVYLVMEYLRGQTLSAHLESLHKREQRLPVHEVLQLGAQLADALAAAHAKSVIHRDLKPSNVMVVPDAAVPGGTRAKLLDFGIAKLARTESPGTATHEVFGTPQYMSPEQCAGAGAVDAKTDVYALGVMLFEMLSGQLPFIAETPLEYMGQHAFKEPPVLKPLAPQAPTQLCELVQQMLRKDRLKRPAMRAVGVELVRFLSSALGPTATGVLPPFMSPVDSNRSSAESAKLAPATEGPPSTLGHSIGQPQRRKTGSRRALLAAVIVVWSGILTLGVRLWRTPASSVVSHQATDLATPAGAPVVNPGVSPSSPHAPLLVPAPQRILQKVASGTPGPLVPTKPTVTLGAKSKPMIKSGPKSAPKQMSKPSVAAPALPETRPVQRED